MELLIALAACAGDTMYMSGQSLCRQLLVIPKNVVSVTCRSSTASVEFGLCLACILCTPDINMWLKAAWQAYYTNYHAHQDIESCLNTVHLRRPSCMLKSANSSCLILCSRTRMHKMSPNLPWRRCYQLYSRSATGLHATAEPQAAIQAPRGSETGLPGAALAFEEPYTLSLDDSARNRVVMAV